MASPYTSPSTGTDLPYSFATAFPTLPYTWRRQLTAVASAGYRAIAPDMRGYGRSSAPADPNLYTPLHTAGDLVGLLDALDIASAVIVECVTRVECRDDASGSI